MGFHTNCYAKVWEVKPQAKYSDVRLTVSRKQTDGTYKQEFGGYVRFVGSAHEKIQGMSVPKSGLSIKLLGTDCQNTYAKDKGVTYYNFAVFDIEDADGNSGTKKAKPATKVENVVDDDIDDNDLPF